MKKKKKDFVFQTNDVITVEESKLEQFFDSMKITMIDKAYDLAKKAFLHFYNLKIYTVNDIRKLSNINAKVYEYIHEHGGLYCPYLTPEEKKKAKEFFDQELNKQINTLKEMYPFIDFTNIDSKAKDIAYRVVFDVHKTNMPNAGMCSYDYPIIIFFIDSNNNFRLPGIATIKHEMCHLCCKSNYFDNPDVCLPDFLKEGITEMITKNSLIHEGYDKDAVNKDLDPVYKPNRKLAELFYEVFSDLTIESYFYDDMTSIINAFKILLQKYPVSNEDNRLYSTDFFKNLYDDLEKLSEYIDRNPESINKGEIPETYYLDSFITYLSYVTKVMIEADKSDAIINKINEFQSSLSKSINKISRNQN